MGAAASEADHARPGESLVLEERLRRFLSARLGATGLEISGLERASYGFSRENWPFDAKWTAPDGTTVGGEFLLRRDPVSGVLYTDRVVEVAVIEALARVGEVPSPEILWSDLAGEHFGRPSLIMRRSPGSCDPFVLSGGTSQLPATQRLQLARRFMELVFLIHQVDWRGLGLSKVMATPAPNSREAATMALDHWEGEFRRHSIEPLPELEYVLAWLRSRTPVSRDVVLVHGDFKPGNTLLEADQVIAVLDWETAHLGDPIEDLGWVTNPMRASEHQIDGVWTPAEMLDHYRELSGREISQHDLTWWNVFANFKLAVITLTGTKSFIKGEMDRVLPAKVYALSVMLDQIRSAGEPDVYPTDRQ